MNLIYLSNSILPSKAANSIHVMKMNQAFSKNGFNNVLFAKKGSQEVNDIYDFYGVDNSFPIKFYRTPATIKGSSIISIVEIVFYLLKGKRENTIIYGRDIYGVMISWLMGFEVIYESHGIPYSRVVMYLEKWLLSRKKNVTFIVISEALKKMYRQFFEGNYKVNVCHDASDIPQIIYKNNFSAITNRLVLTTRRAFLQNHPNL